MSSIISTIYLGAVLMMTILFIALAGVTVVVTYEKKKGRGILYFLLVTLLAFNIKGALDLYTLLARKTFSLGAGLFFEVFLLALLLNFYNFSWKRLDKTLAYITLSILGAIAALTLVGGFLSHPAFDFVRVLLLAAFPLFFFFLVIKFLIKTRGGGVR